MKIFLNTQSYVVGGIPRVVKNMILDRKTSFGGAEFVTVNVEKPRVNGKFQTLLMPGHTSIEGFYDRGKFVKNLDTYHSLDEIEADFKDLIGTFREMLCQHAPNLLVLNGTGIVPWSIMRASEGMGIPTIVYYHGSITIEESAKGDTRPILFEFEKSFFRTEFGYVFPSRVLCAKLEETLGVSIEKYRTVFIPNSVPSYFFHFRPKKP